MNARHHRLVLDSKIYPHRRPADRTPNQNPLQFVASNRTTRKPRLLYTHTAVGLTHHEHRRRHLRVAWMPYASRNAQTTHLAPGERDSGTAPAASESPRTSTAWCERTLSYLPSATSFGQSSRRQIALFLAAIQTWVLSQASSIHLNGRLRGLQTGPGEVPP